MQESTPKISVIVPVYKVEKYLYQCVESIICQTYKNLEIILVDDGSPDNCPEMCDEWASKDSRIKVIHKQNGGLSDARNAGIDVATGRYLFFIDSDDIIEKNCIKDLYDLLVRYDVDISIITKFVFEDGKPIDIDGITAEEPIYGTSYEMLKLMFKRFYCEAWGKLYKAELFDTLRYPKGMIYEDYYLTPRLISKAKNAVFCNSKQYYYRLRENSIMAANTKSDIVKIVDDNYKYFMSCGYNKKQLKCLFKCMKIHLNCRVKNTKTTEEFKIEFKGFEKKYKRECLNTFTLYSVYDIRKLLGKIKRLFFKKNKK